MKNFEPPNYLKLAYFAHKTVFGKGNEKSLETRINTGFSRLFDLARRTEKDIAFYGSVTVIWEGCVTDGFFPSLISQTTFP